MNLVRFDDDDMAYECSHVWMEEGVLEVQVTVSTCPRIRPRGIKNPTPEDYDPLFASKEFNVRMDEHTGRITQREARIGNGRKVGVAFEEVGVLSLMGYGDVERALMISYTKGLVEIYLSNADPKGEAIKYAKRMMDSEDIVLPLKERGVFETRNGANTLRLLGGRSKLEKKLTT